MRRRLEQGPAGGTGASAPNGGGMRAPLPPCFLTHTPTPPRLACVPPRRLLQGRLPQRRRMPLRRHLRLRGRLHRRHVRLQAGRE
jgi:hypothetical protein